MLPTFYQTLLQKYLTQSQLITLKMLVWLLQRKFLGGIIPPKTLPYHKQVKIERLAAALPLPIQQNSRRRQMHKGF